MPEGTRALKQISGHQGAQIDIKLGWRRQIKEIQGKMVICIRLKPTEMMKTNCVH